MNWMAGSGICWPRHLISCIIQACKEEGCDEKLDALTREQRLAMLEDCVCPVCGERHVDFEELLACLSEHDDDGINIASDYIPEAQKLYTNEEAEDILEYDYKD